MEEPTRELYPSVESVELLAATLHSCGVAMAEIRTYTYRYAYAFDLVMVRPTKHVADSDKVQTTQFLNPWLQCS